MHESSRERHGKHTGRREIVEERRQLCENCSNYNEKESFCRKEKRKKLRKEWCTQYQIRLADSYERNIWTEWRDRKQKEIAGRGG